MNRQAALDRRPRIASQIRFAIDSFTMPPNSPMGVTSVLVHRSYPSRHRVNPWFAGEET